MMTKLQLADDAQKYVDGKRAKFASLISRAESTINWGVEWEGDTRVRSFKEAQAEIDYFDQRAASARLRAENEAGHIANAGAPAP